MRRWWLAHAQWAVPLIAYLLVWAVALALLATGVAHP